MIVKPPHCLFILLDSAVQPGPDEQLRREAFTRRVLAWRRGGKGKALPVGLSRAAHQLAGGPLTSQPILNVGLDSGREDAGRGHPSAVTIWVQSAVDPSMHLEYFQKLPMSKLYLMESMHSK